MKIKRERVDLTSRRGRKLANSLTAKLLKQVSRAQWTSGRSKWQPRKIIRTQPTKRSVSTACHQWMENRCCIRNWRQKNEENTYTWIYSLCKLKQMFRKSQGPQTQNEAKLWKVSQEKAAEYLMFK